MSDPTKPTESGMNRTGVATSPIDGPATVEGAKAGTPSPVLEPSGLVAARVSCAEQAAPLGTMPIPTSFKSLAEAAAQMLRGKKPMVFLDLLGERLAFERTGVRLYEGLLVKLEAADPHPGGPSREDLERIRDEELEHFALLKETMTALGADPTAVTPSADVIAVASSGLCHVIGDPRTTLTETLKAILTAELADNDGWLTLADLADRLGHTETSNAFRRALAEEEDHLARVRSWLAAAVEGEAGLEPAPQPGEPAAPVAP
ncbi:MAG TPA: ferritin-like domain-containing protein [Polyangia bacterium]|nr:ferritin-like domain-containing protein [Polyangia bacterium]